MEDDDVRVLLQDYDDMELELAPPKRSDLSSCMQEDDETTSLSDSFSNTLMLVEQPCNNNNNKLEESTDASKLLSFLLADQQLNENVPGGCVNNVEFLFNAVNETTKQYHKVRAELNWLQRRKGKVEKKLGKKQLKRLRDGLETRKRVLISSDDPIVELEKKQVLYEQRLAEKRKDLMKVVKELVFLKSQQPSLKLSGLIQEGKGECSRIGEETAEVRQPSSRTSKKKKEEVKATYAYPDSIVTVTATYAYPDSVVTDLMGTSNLDALFEDTKRMVAADEIKFEELDVGPMIGKGAYGEVYIASWRGVTVAIKRFPLNVPEHRRYVLNTFQREVQCLQQARENPHVVKFFGACVLDHCCYIVMEYMAGGNLHDLLFKQGFRFSLLESVRISLEVAQGIHMLHKQKPEIVHRDLNVSNLLLRQPISLWDRGSLQDWIVIADFSPMGNPRYRAPEFFDADIVYDTKADVYAFGTVLYELLECKPIYEGLADKEVAEKLGAGEYPVMYNIPPMLQKLIISCWKTNPKKRPSFKIICTKLKKAVMKLIAQGNDSGCRAAIV